jgi:hypothetical protein
VALVLLEITTAARRSRATNTHKRSGRAQVSWLRNRETFLYSMYRQVAIFILVAPGSALGMHEKHYCILLSIHSRAGSTCNAGLTNVGTNQHDADCVKRCLRRNRNAPRLYSCSEKPNLRGVVRRRTRGSSMKDSITWDTATHRRGPSDTLWYDHQTS